MKLAANISLLFTELEPLARIRAAREAGFQGIELLFPYDLDPRALRLAAAAEAMPIVQINAPPGSQAGVPPGFAAVPGREDELRASIDIAFKFLQECGSSQLHVLAGAPPTDVDASLVRATYVRNLQWIADEAAAREVRIMIEPLNTRDMPGYALSTLAQAAEVLAAVARPNVGLQFDLYHNQIMGGDLTLRLRKYAHLVRHVQIASVPARNEPDRGEVQLMHFLRELQAVGYTGWVSAEYRPAASTAEGLGWMAPVREWLRAPNQ